MNPRLVPVVAVALACVATGSVRAESSKAPPASPPSLRPVFSELVELGPRTEPGRTAYGTRSIVPITGGSVDGADVRGTVLPGGWDWQLRRTDGCLDISADYFIKTDDGVVIHVVNKGVSCPPGNGGTGRTRTQPVFEAPLGKYAWLSQRSFVGTLERATGPTGGAAVRIGIYLVE